MLAGRFLTRALSHLSLLFKCCANGTRLGRACHGCSSSGAPSPSTSSSATAGSAATAARRERRSIRREETAGCGRVRLPRSRFFFFILAAAALARSLFFFLFSQRTLRSTDVCPFSLCFFSFTALGGHGPSARRVDGHLQEPRARGLVRERRGEQPCEEGGPHGPWSLRSLQSRISVHTGHPQSALKNGRRRLDKSRPLKYVLIESNLVASLGK